MSENRSSGEQYDRQASNTRETEDMNTDQNLAHEHHSASMSHQLHTSLHNQSEMILSEEGTASNALFKNKKPVNYQVINTQHAIPTLE